MVAASPEAARKVAEALRRRFASTEQRSYPAGHDGSTRLHLTVDTTHRPQALQSFHSGVLTDHSSATERPHADEA
ncbi:hypothetical protein [Streptomyces sp. KR80]|uniref:hypothetical protein n=1 Tax=Streptomyces sp. KR80 TaxID=3457426 RepID=UPI003FD1AA43